MATLWPVVAAALTAALSLIGLGVEAKTLWSQSPVSSAKIIRDSFPVGNGRMGGTEDTRKHLLT
jgi:hypothetical protein